MFPVPNSRTAPDDVTQLVREWLREQRQEKTLEALGTELGVTKAAIRAVLEGERNVGRKIEQGFAALLYDGSIDALRKAAKEAAAARAPASSRSAVPKLRQAMGVVEASRGPVPDDIAQALGAAADSLGDLPLGLWIAILENMLDVRAAKA